jgi:phytoene dehydrogenase-like protein
LKTKYDAVVVGSGPNGFAAAITLQRRGLSVLLVEAKETLGGGVSSAALTLPGFIHDVCASVFALAEDSPVFKYFNLQQSGLEYVTPEYAIAHPFDDGNAIAVETSIENIGKRVAIYSLGFCFATSLERSDKRKTTVCLECA